ncbi:MAG: transcription-repair coupling factor [Flavobacteriaceae bacterium]|nr:transcription-repair coupling factor [Flavobacteriaceae bacterium]
MTKNSLLTNFNGSLNLERLGELISKNEITSLKGLFGSSLSFYISALYKKLSSPFIIVFNSKQEALYFLNDIEIINPNKKIFYYPETSKEPYSELKINNYNLLQRTELIEHLNFSKKNNSIIVTYVNAISENQISKQELNKISIKLKVGENISFDNLNEQLFEFDFRREDFVIEPGEFAVRGGILDIFPYSSQTPFRIEFFGDEITRIRSFDIDSQRSEENHKSIKIISNTQVSNNSKAVGNIFNILQKNTYVLIQNLEIFYSEMDKILSKANLNFEKIIDKENQIKPDKLFVDPISLKNEIKNFKIIEFESDTSNDNLKLNILPQPSFNKSFNFLIEDLNNKKKLGYSLHLCCTNKQQKNRLKQIFTDLNNHDIINPIILPISKGFVDNSEKTLFYTDHQIFERYHKFKFKKRFKNKLSIAMKQLNHLNKGDYITHIDHGIGKYAGLQKIEIDGNLQESIKIIYGERDILYLSIHAIHKISKYNGKDGKVPRIYKLGSKAWALLKQKTKKNAKKIAYDLIKVYAERKQKKGFKYDQDSYLQNELEASFIYEDTEDQMKVTRDIKNDMESDQPMDRLICGDVGFGKTELAIRAAFKAVDNNKQVAVLVPTTILAFQHFKTFSNRLEDLPVSVNYINRFKTNKEKSEIIKNLGDGKIDIIIGTHQLVNEKIKYKNLGLLIIDEEQKFGVSVKDKIKSVRKNVDVLTLSATPIPRTLQFSLMAARDLSLITTPPPNRHPIETSVIRFDSSLITQSIRYEIERGGQVFFVNNKIQNIEEISNLLKNLVPEAKIAVAHGRLNGKTLESLMIKFINKQFDVLVSTTIIESGLDVPNANTIFINNANNFGLSDLHQMRGRVGRSNKKAFCYLITPEFSKMTDEAKKRITALDYYSELGSGFNIAMKDLEIRGAGDLLGGEQSGFINEMGFETYQKILDEAIDELKKDDFKDLDLDKNKFSKNTNLIFETDLELMFPNDFINSSKERLNLYNKLNKISSVDELEEFKQELTDRFGKLPEIVEELLKSIKLRWISTDLGFEKIVLKKQMLLAYLKDFENNSQKKNLEKIFKYSKKNNSLISFSQKKTADGERFIIKLFDIDSISKAIKVLNDMNN